MKLFGLPAPVAKELRVSWFFRLQISRHQMMIRDEHTSRCSSRRRVRVQSETGKQRRRKTSLCWRRSPFQKTLTRLETRRRSRFEGRMTRNFLGSCEITRQTRTHNNNTSSIVTVNFQRRAFHPFPFLKSALLSARRRSRTGDFKRVRCFMNMFTRAVTPNADAGFVSQGAGRPGSQV